MATITNLRSRRSEAQLHALEVVEREIRANDHNGRRKYLKDFHCAFSSYESTLTPEELTQLVGGADIVLIGDYHALAASQRFAASLLEERAQPGDRPVVLGVETIFSRDQHILDEWWRREIDEAELRQRIRFDLDWDYEWAPFYELLVTAREHADAIYGLDCMPREDLRKIGARDRHAAHKIAEIRQRHPAAVILTLFGESHLAPGHLPRLLGEQLPGQRCLTVLQNVDALYWQASGERQEWVGAVRVSDDVVCVFNSTPLEKYESYRLCLSRWSQGSEEEDKTTLDVTPTIYNLVDSLLRFLDINRYSSHNGTQPKFLVDLLPEVHGREGEGRLLRLLSKQKVTNHAIDAILQRVEERGSIYLPQLNAFYVREFQMTYAAEESARFLHHACRNLPSRANGHIALAGGPTDHFYLRVLEHALAYFGSRVLYPARSAVREEEPSESPRAACAKLMQAAALADGDAFDPTSEQLGYAVGSRLYDAYLQGRVRRGTLRSVFLGHAEDPGRAREICWRLVRKIHSPRRKSPTSGLNL